MNKEKIFIIAGEDSGDLHGAKLIESIKKINPFAEFIGIGGIKMQGAGLKATEHIKNLNVIGIFEVIKHYPRIKKIFNQTLDEIKKEKPDKIILIDYPGFNLRLAKKLKSLDFHVTYFILPQVWAWKESRAKSLDENCNKLISIIPFEKSWFAKKGINVHYAGHPLAKLSNYSYDREKFCIKHNIPLNNKIILLMPGSRRAEIKRHWTIFEDSAKILFSKRGDLSFVLVEGQNVSINPDIDLIKIKKNQYEAINLADAAIICSGTATLEATMLRCPMIVCYKLSSATWFLAKILSKVEYLSLSNLIAKEEVVKEYLQNDMNAKNLSDGVINLLKKGEKDILMKKYHKLINKLKNDQNPYDSAARYIYD
tara:strand:+ start:5788 stop:6891 length:1104 start_codon:yes stop_codon:yes gene_type:complete